MGMVTPRRTRIDNAPRSAILGPTGLISRPAGPSVSASSRFRREVSGGLAPFTSRDLIMAWSEGKKERNQSEIQGREFDERMRRSEAMIQEACHNGNGDSETTTVLKRHTEKAWIAPCVYKMLTRWYEETRCVLATVKAPADRENRGLGGFAAASEKLSQRECDVLRWDIEMVVETLQEWLKILEGSAS